MEALIRRKHGVRLLRIDIDHWGSPVARAHGIRKLPSLVLYDGERRVSRDTGRILRKLREL